MTTAPAAPSRPGGGSGLQRKLGPFPLWVYLLAGAGGVAFWYYRRQQSAAGTAAAATATSAGDAIDPATGVPYADEQAAADTNAYEGSALDDLESFLASQEAQGGSGGTTGNGKTPKKYRPLGSPAAARAAIKQGRTIFTRGANGAYTPVPKGAKLPKGTPEYIEVT